MKEAILKKLKTFVTHSKRYGQKELKITAPEAEILAGMRELKRAQRVRYLYETIDGKPCLVIEDHYLAPIIVNRTILVSEGYPETAGYDQMKIMKLADRLNALEEISEIISELKATI